MDKRIPSIFKKSTYKDPFFECTPKEYDDLLEKSKTIYVGNLSFYTSEEQLMTIFSMIGPVRNIIMGLDRYKYTPCGFCFIEFFDRKSAMEAIKSLTKLAVDGRYLRLDLDPGYSKGRELGRGKSGGQMQDDYRRHYDKQRGGWVDTEDF